MLEMQKFFNRGKEFWVRELAQVGANFDFDEVTESETAPEAELGYGNPILSNMILGGYMVDVYRKESTSLEGKKSVSLYIHAKR
ncbi:MAG TPA: hypothetical protein VFQ59_00900 [Candidatus Paceibacterota bacterium]|nr:hypothetical protein [Candidatus Paceibacterota bacterium]